MIKITDIVDVANIPDLARRKFIFKEVEGLLSSYEPPFPFNPENDGHWEYFDNVHDIETLPPKWLWEDVSFNKELKMYTLIHLRDNEFGITYYIPEEVYSQDKAVVNELNSLMEFIHEN